MTAAWDRRPGRERERVEELTLSTWLPAVTSFASYWQARVESLGLAAAELTDRGALRSLPAVRESELLTAGGPGAPGLVMRPTEEQIKAHGSGGVLWSVARSIRESGGHGKREALLREYKPVQVLRGGADGELAIAGTRSDLDRLHLTGARAAAVLGLTDVDYLVSALPAGPTLEFWGIYHLALGASLLALHPRGHGDGLDEVVGAFGVVPATAVAVQPHEAVELAERVADSDAGCRRLDTILLVGPPPDAGTRAAVEAAWRKAGAAEDDLAVRSVWAPGTVRCLWAECREGATGLHTYPDLGVLELTDPVTGEPVESEGDLTYTSAGWHGTALLRLRTGTYVENLTTAPCPACERTVPRLTGEALPGVWQPPLRSGGAPGRVDLRGAAGVLATAPGLTTWRIELAGPQAAGGDDRLLVEVAGEIDDDSLDELYDLVTEAGGVEPAELAWSPDPDVVDARAAELGSVLADVR